MKPTPSLLARVAAFGGGVLLWGLGGWSAGGAVLGGAAAMMGAVAPAISRAMAARPLRREPLMAGQSGQAFVETAIIMPIAIEFVMIMFQYGLILAATSTLNWSAWSAARTAAVVVPQGPVEFNRQGEQGRYKPIFRYRVPFDDPLTLNVDEREASKYQVWNSDPFDGDWQFEKPGRLRKSAESTVKWRRIHWSAAYCNAALVTSGAVTNMRPQVDAWVGANKAEFGDHALLLAAVDERWRTSSDFITATGSGRTATERAQTILEKLAVSTLLTEVYVKGGGDTGNGEEQFFAEGTLIQVEVLHYYPLVIPLVRKIFGRRAYVRDGYDQPEGWLKGRVSLEQESDGKDVSYLTDMYVFPMAARAALPCEDIR